VATTKIKFKMKQLNEMNKIPSVLLSAFNRKQGLSNDEANPNLEELVRLARRLGASDVCLISSKEILVEDGLANLCREPQCMNYGLSPSCPPHVGGPSEFRKLQKHHKQAIIVRLVVPSAALFSDERRGIMRLLHEIVAGIEQEAVKMGFIKAKAFAGGSCKNIFCDEYGACRVLSEEGECRNPEYARPSMSGFGINVSELMKTCGWPADIKVNEAEAAIDPLSWVAGLILVD
jgi:predicted metal-binding protein